MDTEDIYAESHYDEFDESDPYARNDPYAAAEEPIVAEVEEEVRPSAPVRTLPESNVPVSKRQKGQISSAVFNVLNAPSLIDEDLTGYMPRPPVGSASLAQHEGEGQASTIETVMPVIAPQKTVVFREGYLTKLGAKFKTWKKRWFVLEKKELRYYKSKGGALIGTIVLSEACEVTLNLDKKHCVSLICPDRTWLFIAANDDEMNEWRSQIQEGIWLK